MYTHNQSTYLTYIRNSYHKTNIKIRFILDAFILKISVFILFFINDKGKLMPVACSKKTLSESLSILAMFNEIAIVIGTILLLIRA